MTKELYVDEIVDLVEEMLEEKNLSDDYELSSANESTHVNRNPILVIEFPDDSCRAYDIPYREALVENIEHANELNVSSFVDGIKADVLSFENELSEDKEEEEEVDEEWEDDYEDNYEDEEEYDTRTSHSDEFYKEFDTDYLPEFISVVKDYMADKGLSIPEGIDEEEVFEDLNDRYQHNDKTFKKTMEKKFDKVVAKLVEERDTREGVEPTVEEEPTNSETRTRLHDETFYEDYDTDYESDFIEMAKQYIRDNADKLKDDVREVIECLDFEEINSDYQTNNLSFRQSMLMVLDDIGALAIDIDSVFHDYDGSEVDEDEEYDNYDDDDYDEDEDEEYENDDEYSF